MNLLQPATNPAAGHRGAHRPNATLARAAATVSRLGTAVNLRPVLRRAALAAAGTGAAGALALGPSALSSAAAVGIGPTNSQAGYLVGGNHYQFRYVQAVITPPTNGCTTNQLVADNYLRSGVQLIAGGTMPGSNVAVGVECLHGLDAGYYYAGWAAGYAGNTFPHLPTTGIRVQAGEHILLTLSYDQAHNVVSITAADNTTGKTLLSAQQAGGGGTHGAQYLQAMLSADVTNPLPHPPPPGTSKPLMPFTDCYVITYADLYGIGIKPPANASWSVQKRVETDTPVGGNLVAAPTGLTTVQPPPPQHTTSEFGINIFGPPGIGP
jgi:YD repeat-containing protein